MSKLAKEGRVLNFSEFVEFVLVFSSLISLWDILGIWSLYLGPTKRVIDLKEENGYGIRVW